MLDTPKLLSEMQNGYICPYSSQHFGCYEKKSVRQLKLGYFSVKTVRNFIKVCKLNSLVSSKTSFYKLTGDETIFRQCQELVFLKSLLCFKYDFFW